MHQFHTGLFALPHTDAPRSRLRQDMLQSAHAVVSLLREMFQFCHPPPMKSHPQAGERSVKPTDMVVSPMGLRFMNRRFPCTIGRGGITTDKHEGDGCTPMGTHGIVGMLYRPDRIAKQALPNWAVPIRPRDLWSDDPNDLDYNQMVRAPYPYSHERLTRADPQYDLVLITDWNWFDPIPGQGSAIFIHTWRRPCHPTAGCIGLARTDLMWIANRLTPQSRLIVG